MDAARTITGPGGGGSTRSIEKRAAILAASRSIFLRHGYGGASMDEVAAIASVSKQTVYKHFTDKKALFTEVITGDIESADRLTQDLLRALPESENFEADLREFARQHITSVLQPDIIRMRRLIIGEADRFPELARTWYATAPERCFATLAEHFIRLTERGLLRIEDPLLAAQEFNWLVLSIPLNRAMFHPDEMEFTNEELHKYADEGVRVFLAAYTA
jgi:TetR/AcrR family transcriptional regulator, mexJK operon transcriptional repressor